MPVCSEHAFSFVDPANILRGPHISPWFWGGMVHAGRLGISMFADDKDDCCQSSESQASNCPTKHWYVNQHKNRNCIETRALMLCLGIDNVLGSLDITRSVVELCEYMRSPWKNIWPCSPTVGSDLSRRSKCLLSSGMTFWKFLGSVGYMCFMIICKYHLKMSKIYIPDCLTCVSKIMSPQIAVRLIPCTSMYCQLINKSKW